MLYYEQAGYRDCRTAAFAVDQTNPNLIFIDIDASDFQSLRGFKSALHRTLKKIEKEIGGHPSVLWSGRGYDGSEPINCIDSLDRVKEFSELAEPGCSSSNNNDIISNSFLRFASVYLSANKRDRKNYPSLNSCLLRIPSSLNSKCLAAGAVNAATVRILQEWDGKRPDVRMLIGSFHSYLVAKRLERQSMFREYYSQPATSEQVTPWIEKLLQTGIDDNRKDLILTVLAPYLITVRGLDYDRAFAIIVEWLDRCDKVRRLKPSWTDFRYRVRYSLRRALNASTGAFGVREV